VEDTSRRNAPSWTRKPTTTTTVVVGDGKVFKTRTELSRDEDHEGLHELRVAVARSDNARSVRSIDKRERRAASLFCAGASRRRFSGVRISRCVRSTAHQPMPRFRLSISALVVVLTRH